MVMSLIYAGAFFVVLGVVVFAWFVVSNSRRTKRFEASDAGILASAIDTAAIEAADGEPVRSVQPTTQKRSAPKSIEGTLGRSRGVLGSALAKMKSRRALTEEFWDELEEALLLSDVGVALTGRLLGEVRASVTAAGIVSTDEAVEALRGAMIASLSQLDRSINLDVPSPAVIIFVGVNGVGKTTSIGKLANSLSGEGRKVVVAAGDTFRAAAAEQLEMWSDRAGVELVRGEAGGDPASVIFDAIAHASAVSAGVVLADTAGRLQNRVNLMEELKKIRRVAEKASGTVSEVLLVLDATTGQNGLAQAKAFSDASGITGIILSKLDGSAKGGVAFAIEEELGIPIKLVGIGEGVDDLVPFDPASFVSELTGDPSAN